MSPTIQTLYYVAGILVAVLGVVKSAYNGIVHRMWTGIKRIEKIEEKVDTIQEGQTEMREEQRRMDDRQERLVAAIVAATAHPDEVDPIAVEDILSDDDDGPTPRDFYASGDVPGPSPDPSDD